MKKIILTCILIFFGTLTNSPGPFENPKSDAHAFDAPGTLRADSASENIEEDKLVLYLEEVPQTTMGTGIEELFNGDNTPPSRTQNPGKKSDTRKKNAHQELTKIRTKIKCVESVLKKAALEAYRVNGQIEGLRINGLEKISQAKALLLKSGDIIIAVNGQSLSSRKDAYYIFKKARKEPTMIVDLLQDGETKKLIFDFN
jgi:type II secretory pathway component PulC